MTSPFVLQQEDDQPRDPEVMGFRTSQRILNPNQPTSLNSTPKSRNSMSNNDKAEIVKQYKNGNLKTRSVMKGKKHACLKQPASFTPEQKKQAKESALSMVKKDLFPFAIVNKPGFLKFTLDMLRLGADLGVRATANATIDDVRDLLPHPTTLSNQINTFATRKEQLYAILRRKSNDSGISIMIDGTSKSFHYTGISVSFIDENWLCQTVLCDLIAGHEKGESTADYVIVKANEFLRDFGVNFELINAFNTDEAAAMLAAFRATRRHIICICHLISTICKHSFALYAKDKEAYPQIHDSLQVVVGLKKSLKEVITAVKNKIYINKTLSHPLYQSNETRFLSFTTSLHSFLTLTPEDHEIINRELNGHVSYASYLQLIEAKNDLVTIYNTLHVTNSALRSLEADKSPTLHLVVPVFSRLYNSWNTLDDPTDEIEYALKNAGLLALKEKVPVLHDYHYYAVILDPNVKLRINDIIIPDRNGLKRNVDELIPKLREAVKQYVIKTRRYRPLPNPPVTANNPFAHLVSTQAYTPDLVVNAEIDKYLIDEETYDTTILAFWKKSAAHYPFLSSFAKYILSIPASSCPLERSFSVLNKVDCKARPQLDQETISNIVLSNAMEKYMPSISS